MNGRFDFDGLPISGADAGARHASASGAEAAAVPFSARASRLLAAFAKFGRLTIAQASEVTGIKESSVCSAWRALEKAGYIEGTREFYSYTCHERIVRREYHRLTGDGKRVAFEQLKALVKLHQEGLS